MKKLYFIFISLILLLIITSCGYFNLFYNAKKYYREGNYERSKQKCNKIISDEDLSHLHDDSYFILGNIYYDMGDNKKAYFYYEKIIKNYPDSKHYLNSLTNIMQILVNNKKYQRAYNFYNNTLEGKPNKRLKYLYAETLIKLNYNAEFEKYIQSNADKKDDFPVLWSYYYYENKNFTNLFSTIELIKSNKVKSKFIQTLFIKDFYYKIFKKYYKNSNKYKFLKNILYPEVEISQIDKYYDKISSLNFELRNGLYSVLLSHALEKEQFKEAKQLGSLLVSSQKSKARKKERNFEYSAEIKSSFQTYKDLPDNWSLLLHDSTDPYLIEQISSSDWRLYALEDEIWQEKSMNNPPATFPSNYVVVWDKINKRWIFLEFDSSQIYALNKDNFRWETLKLENGVLDNIAKENVFIENNFIYLFYKLSKIYRIEIESNDILTLEQLDIKGIVPDLKEYTFLFNKKDNLFMALGGKENDIRNYNGYILNYIKDPPKWENVYLESDLNFYENTIKYLEAGSRQILISWPNNNTKNINGLYLFDYSRQDNFLKINKCINIPKTVDDFFEYAHLFTRYQNVYFYYRDPNISYNNLKILKTNFQINSSTVKEEKNEDEELLSLTDALINDISNDNIKKIVSGINKILEEDALSEKKKAEIYLSYFNMPEKAYNYYKKALDENPKNPKLLYALGYLNMKYLKNYSGAESYFREFLDYASEENPHIEEVQKYINQLPNQK
ncbi:MAG: tetratricopeptide repeat protein [Candidatus Mcinerneyibacterium aminivorans]|uniref:Tetratricopeptide repeat protein n=1 Tax=Candidatus Mcinerneyibacterium aminivorans TaxID=2703815 RepID=A0A5D0MA49_9BACT|nr:MAG: tetratricopeptide repeat protein [Candidatus Mcinerneyibacterium aminivorans]